MALQLQLIPRRWLANQDQSHWAQWFILEIEHESKFFQGLTIKQVSFIEDTHHFLLSTPLMISTDLCSWRM